MRWDGGIQDEKKKLQLAKRTFNGYLLFQFTKNAKCIFFKKAKQNSGYKLKGICE